MSKYVWKKMSACMLILTLLLGMTEPAVRVVATEIEESGEGIGENDSNEPENPDPAETAAPEATPKEVVTITPFAGQWKYFGQERTFYPDVHFSLSNGASKLEGVSVELESEEVGMQKFKIVDSRTDKEKSEVGYRLDPDAALYEIKPYSVPAGICVEDAMVNLKARKYLKPDPENEKKYLKKIEAPEGYRISKSMEEGTAQWGESMTVSLEESKEGDKNTFTYYLASNQTDNTRKAVDQTPKTVTICADWTAPALASVTGEPGSDVAGTGQITGNESGKYYYIVLPREVGEEEKKDAEGERIVTAELIRNRVASHYGIVGYGRIEESTESVKKPADISFNGLLAETDYMIYAYMEDDAGNESDVVASDPFQTDRIALAGTVEISGTMAIDQTVEAKVTLDSAAPGVLTYQWYRITNKDDAEGLDEVWDETGGAEEDDLEAEDDDEEDDAEEDDEYELDSIRKFAVDDAGTDADDITVIDKDAVLIQGATQPTYKITKDDIGHRLICRVEAEKYSGYVAGESSTFVPKLIPELTLPAIRSAVYSPERTLSSIKLPERWNWVDDTIVPVYGNSGYRARYVPENSALYRTVIVRVKVPVTKKALAKKMLTLKKTHAYTGKAIKDNFEVEDGQTELTAGKDYKATYKNNKKLGKASITLKGAGNYKGQIKASYRIVACSVKSLTFRYNKKKSYNGKERTAGLVVKNGTVKLKKGNDYTVQYKNNIEIGRAAVFIQGIGNYKGKKKLNFQIIPAKPKIIKVTKKKKSFRLRFSQNEQAKGYRVFVSASKSFAPGKTQEYITTGTDFGVYGLTAGTYYVRINCYSSKKGKTYVSSYSRKRTIKIKK